ncbi:uncharacterized protein CEXT_787031 [Caerostris extrusa]|uniref:Uncharacterized protein n=1 Tax=Caerostris extrusa TaxID=172846 RepID=A0AAV4TH18_CAEEX|nr:uncharacterized protein CEXT_787031 [Caerostris extrusa]
MDDDAPRPMVISLPINVAMQSRSPPSYEQEESAEEQQGNRGSFPECTIPILTPNIHKMKIKTMLTITSKRSNNFLSWNPGNKFMVLQISDFMGNRNQEPEESEEQERVREDTRIRKQRKPSQGTFDFDDYRRSLEPARRPDRVKKQRSSTERKTKSKSQDTEDEEEDGEVYGTDPVVHYLKEKKRKSKKRNYDFSDMKQDDDDEFAIRDWWNY